PPRPSPVLSATRPGRLRPGRAAHAPLPTVPRPVRPEAQQPLPGFGPVRQPRGAGQRVGEALEHARPDPCGSEAEPVEATGPGHGADACDQATEMLVPQQGLRPWHVEPQRQRDRLHGRQRGQARRGTAEREPQPALGRLDGARTDGGEFDAGHFLEALHDVGYELGSDLRADLGAVPAERSTALAAALGAALAGALAAALGVDLAGALSADHGTVAAALHAACYPGPRHRPRALPSV